MRILCAISSCEYYENTGLNQPSRDTWIPEAKKLGLDCIFFHGRGATTKDDVIIVDVPDEMYGLTEKLRAKCRWAIDKGYDFVFSCFPDTYVCPERLLVCGFENCDYIGNVYQFSGSAPFCQGGPGYFLSRKSCQILADSTELYLNDDAWAGDVLNAAGVVRADHRGFTAFGPGPLKYNNSITVHLSTQPGGYTGHNMTAEHERWLESLL
jgi:hypothetical protein